MRLECCQKFRKIEEIELIGALTVTVFVLKVDLPYRNFQNVPIIRTNIRPTVIVFSALKIELG